MVGVFSKQGGTPTAPVAREEVSPISVHSRNDREWRDVIAPRIKRRDGYFCTIRAEGCEGDKHLSIDHHVPISRGGSDDDSNLFTACRMCNSKKSNKTISRIEWSKEGWFD